MSCTVHNDDVKTSTQMSRLVLKVKGSSATEVLKYLKAQSIDIIQLVPIVKKG